MAEKPIVFGTPMVQAILDGRKTQTRLVITRLYRLLKHGGPLLGGHVVGEEGDPHNPLGFMTGCGIERPAYHHGDILWVRETWTTECGMLLHQSDGKPIHYCADCKDDTTGLFAPCKWKKRSSRYMPRAAARIFLRATDVRVERLQEISEADAIAEGCASPPSGKHYHDGMDLEPITCARDEYAALWDSLNAKRGYEWDANPWVWVYTFERMATNDQN